MFVYNKLEHLFFTREVDKMERVILHCDMNNFFASVECKLNPELDKYPMAVCGSKDERKGIVLSKNEKAKKYGVKTGETIWNARVKCRELLTVRPHFEEYIKVSAKAREIYMRYTDMIEPFGIDECWLDVTASVYLFESGEAIAEKIRKEIKDELGVTVSVGVSFNKVFAKLGSDMKKPDAVTVIEMARYMDKIGGLPATDMIGVGPSVGKKLESYGIYTIEDIAIRSEKFFNLKFGKIGSHMWRNASGLDNSPVVSKDIDCPEKSVGHGMTAPKDLTTPEEVYAYMLELTRDIGHRMNVYEKKARGISVAVKDSSFSVRSWQAELPIATSSSSYIAKRAFSLFLKEYTWARPVRAVTVRAINMVPFDAPMQVSLFSDINEIEKAERLDKAIDELRERYGRRIITNASVMR